MEQKFQLILQSLQKSKDAESIQALVDLQAEFEKLNRWVENTMNLLNQVVHNEQH